MTDPFELLEQVGAGGMGTVWKARLRSTGQIVAVKLMHAQYAHIDEYVQRLEREIDIGTRVNSPHVVKVLGHGARDGIPFMVMEFVDGPSLRALLRERGPLPWDGPGQARDILQQVALGLDALHRAGIIHRDVKPSNILIGADGVVKLADFGISRPADATRVTATAATMGTPVYMAPDAELTAQSDLYNLGVVAFEILAGSPPFQSDITHELLVRHMRETPNIDRLPREARPIVAQLLAKNPAARPRSAAVLAAMLAPGGPPQRRAGPPVWALIAAPVGLIALLLALGLFLSSRGGGTEANASARGVATRYIGGGSSGASSDDTAGPSGLTPGPDRTRATLQITTPTPPRPTSTPSSATPQPTAAPPTAQGSGGAGGDIAPTPAPTATTAATSIPTPFSTPSPLPLVPTATPTRTPTPTPPPTPTPVTIDPSRAPDPPQQCNWWWWGVC